MPVGKGREPVLSCPYCLVLTYPSQHNGSKRECPRCKRSWYAGGVTTRAWAARPRVQYHDDPYHVALEYHPDGVLIYFLEAKPPAEDTTPRWFQVWREKVGFVHYRDLEWIGLGEDDYRSHFLAGDGTILSHIKVPKARKGN